MRPACSARWPCPASSSWVNPWPAQHGPVAAPQSRRIVPSILSTGAGLLAQPTSDGCLPAHPPPLPRWPCSDPNNCVNPEIVTGTPSPPAPPRWACRPLTLWPRLQPLWHAMRRRMCSSCPPPQKAHTWGQSKPAACQPVSTRRAPLLPPSPAPQPAALPSRAAHAPHGCLPSPRRH